MRRDLAAAVFADEPGETGHVHLDAVLHASDARRKLADFEIADA